MILIERDRSWLGLLHIQSRYWTQRSLIIWPSLLFPQLELLVIGGPPLPFSERLHPH